MYIVGRNEKRCAIAMLTLNIDQILPKKEQKLPNVNELANNGCNLINLFSLLSKLNLCFAKSWPAAVVVAYVIRTDAQYNFVT